MARKPSVILTPAEKKAAVTTAKDAVSSAKKALSAAEKARKQLEKDHALAIKASDKNLAALRKDLIDAEKSLNALVPPKAVPSPTSDAGNTNEQA